MPYINSKSSKSATAALVLVLASLALAACGGSSSNSSSTANASATKPTSGAAGAFAGRFSAFRECLQKNGVVLPKHTRGQRPAPGAGGLLGGPQLPKGVTPAQYEAAVKKCGGFPHLVGPGGGPRFNSPALKQSLAKFAACMREHGVNVPEPNTSGSGPVFNDKGLDTTGPTFQAAQAKCRADLLGGFRAHPGGTGAPGSPAPSD